MPRPIKIFEHSFFFRYFLISYFFLFRLCTHFSSVDPFTGNENCFFLLSFAENLVLKCCCVMIMKDRILLSGSSNKFFLNFMCALYGSHADFSDLPSKCKDALLVFENSSAFCSLCGSVFCHRCSLYCLFCCVMNLDEKLHDVWWW